MYVNILTILMAVDIRAMIIYSNNIFIFFFLLCFIFLMLVFIYKKKEQEFLLFAEIILRSVESS